MIVPAILAVVIWTYNACKIVELKSGKSNSQPDVDKEEGETIPNSPEAINHIRRLRKNNFPKERNYRKGVGHGEAVDRDKKRRDWNKAHYPREEAFSQDVRGMREVQLFDEEQEIR